MTLRTEPAGVFARILALVSLFLGLSDAARLLGVPGGATSPMGPVGTAGYFWLAAFCLARLFAAVGLWIHALWGAVLLATVLGVEVLLYLFGVPWVDLTLVGFIVRVVVFSATILLLVLARHLVRRHAPD